MNSLIILPEELTGSHTARLDGERANYAFSTHGVRAEQHVKYGILNAERGFCRVLSASSDCIELILEEGSRDLEQINIDLIVGVSRPQTVKKVIQAAVMFGVKTLSFVRSEHGEKSYLQSHSLNQAEVQFETIKALEQVWATRPPLIEVYDRFSKLVDSRLRINQAGRYELRLIAHPGGKDLASNDFLPTKLLKNNDSRVVIAIGPERGWSTGEVEKFSEIGFHHIGLGERVVRVELALVFLLGQLAALGA